MTATLADLQALAAATFGEPVTVEDRLAGGGSARAFYRLRAGLDGCAVIGVMARSAAEVRAFLGFTRHFAAQGIPVPQMYGEDAARGLYLMEDLGSVTLAHRLHHWRAQPGGESQARAALETVVRWLPIIQVRGGEGLDDALCWEGRALDGAVFRADVERFLAHYLPRRVGTAPPLDGAVREDLDALLARLDALPREHFCYRDFQTRNIMWPEREQRSGPVFLDYQSGRRGPLAYDLASLLYSPDTGADDALRERLIAVYLVALGECGAAVDRAEFMRAFYPLVLIRRLQALGAYAQLAGEGRQGAYLERIPPALATLRDLQARGRFRFGLPALERWLERVFD